MLKTAKVLLLTLLALTIVGLSFGAGFGIARDGNHVAALPMLETTGGKTGLPPSFNILSEVLQILQQDFVKKEVLTEDNLTQGAIKGMLESLGDAHTSYITPEQLRSEQQAIKGSYEGIGAFVNLEASQLTIISPIAGSPAEKAGIKPGDRILEVDGKTTSSLTLQQAVDIIQGPKGTKVVLTILHKGDTDPVKIEVIRDTVRTSSVLSKMLDNDIAYIRIGHFSETTGDEIGKALKDLQQKHPKSLIVDLRSNPGGLLDTTVDVTSQFLKDGVVLYQVDSKGQKQTYRVRSGGLATDIPMVLLVDGTSASGSEVMAGALQDRKRAILIGEKTYGKGTVNHTRALSNGGAIYVTIAYWLTPEGRQIEGQGLTPDIEVKLTDDDIKNGRDPQMDRAIEYLKTGK